MKISNEFKIGFWTIAAIAVLVFGIQYLKGINSLHLGTFYYVACDDVEGLATSGPVKVNGFQVGLIRSMEYDFKKTGKVIVEINIDQDDLQIPSDSKAMIQSDLLGTSSLVIELGTATTILKSRDTIQGGERMAGILDKAEPIIPAINALMPKIDSLICGVNILVNDSKMQESLLEINSLTTQLNRTVKDLNKMLEGDVPAILANINSTTENLDTISSQIASADVNRLLIKANETLEKTNTLLASLSTNDGTAGKIINTTELHDQLTEAISSVNNLIEDIKENPKRYINIKLFGK